MILRGNRGGFPLTKKLKWRKIPELANCCAADGKYLLFGVDTIIGIKTIRKVKVKP